MKFLSDYAIINVLFVCGRFFVPSAHVYRHVGILLWFRLHFYFFFIYITICIVSISFTQPQYLAVRTRDGEKMATDVLFVLLCHFLKHF